MHIYLHAYSVILLTDFILVIVTFIVNGFFILVIVIVSIIFSYSYSYS